MRIGEFAKRAGVGIQTIRFYEREGLLPPPPRTAAGYREFTIEDLERVRVIRVCQKIGFTLGDIKGLLEPHRALASLGLDLPAKQEASRNILKSATARLDQLDEMLATLQGVRSGMAELVAGLTKGELRTCPAAKAVKHVKVAPRPGPGAVPRQS